MMIETEVQLITTLCHLGPPCLEVLEYDLAPITQDWEAFSRFNIRNVVNKVG